MSSTHVLLLRHAETATPELWHGAESDVGLSERGVRQALLAAPVLAAERPTAIISSAMRRAVHTAEPIAAACGLTLRIEPDLHERRIGTLSGTCLAHTDSIWKATLARWMSGETGYAHDGAESFDDVRGRVLPVWSRLAQEHAEQTYMVIAHGGVIKVLLLSLDVGLSDWHSFRCHNLGITELVQENGRWRIVRLGEVPENVRTME